MTDAPLPPPGTADVAHLAADMLAQSIRDGQSARRVASDDRAAALRQALREMARTKQVRIRTARTDDLVVVARTDADLWNDDAATMRAKLTPPS